MDLERVVCCPLERAWTEGDLEGSTEDSGRSEYVGLGLDAAVCSSVCSFCSASRRSKRSLSRRWKCLSPKTHQGTCSGYVCANRYKPKSTFWGMSPSAMTTGGQFSSAVAGRCDESSSRVVPEGPALFESVSSSLSWSMRARTPNHSSSS